MDKINVMDKLARVRGHFSPKIIAELNGQEVKVVKFKGSFVWHHHEKEDELFYVLARCLRMDFQCAFRTDRHARRTHLKSRRCSSNPLRGLRCNVPQSQMARSRRRRASITGCKYSHISWRPPP